MRIAAFRIEGREEIGLVHGTSLTSVTRHLANSPSTLQALIEQWDRYAPSVRALPFHADYDLKDVTLLPPIRRPGKIFGIGLNYDDHVGESGMARPEVQTWFTKAVTAVTGPFDPIELPLASEMLDYEAELVFVIGKRCKQVPAERAMDVIFGFCVGNDVSVRDWQLRSGQFSLGKSFDTHAPFGPWLVTPDEIDPGNLDIRSWVNGELRQQSNTRHLIFDCAAQVAHLSRAMTLETGDVIFTGTPGGVGGASKPPKWLKAGDRVRVEIAGIGNIDNPVVNESRC